MEFPVKIFLVLCFVSLHSHAIEVSTRNGVIIGSDRLRTWSGNKVIYSFTGIPYAQPPVGALRFKEPQPLRPWRTPINATGKCPDCLQRRLFPLPSEKAANPNKGQEDCLRINVFTPSLDIKAKLPVMLHIHGGAYKLGSANLEPQFLLPHVVFASITYRLNVLGFATTGDGIIPANLGIKDQVMALKWIQENIEAFGGDPNRVTVFGDSAGGSSVHLLLLSPLTKGLIHGGISSSGTAACPWAMIDRELAITRTKKVATLCGCPSQPSEALLECLQKTPVDNLVESFQNFRDDFSLPLTEFAPVIEESTAKNAVLTTDPRMIKSELPWITGLNTAEHMNYSGRFLQNVENKNLNLTEQFDVFLNKWLSYGFNITEEEIPAVAKKIKEFYFGAGNSINKENIKHLDLVIADGWFLKGISDAVPFHAGPTYVYYYDYEQSDKTTYKSLIGYGVGDGKGAGHMDNILNLFPSAKRFPRRQLSPLDMETSKNMVSLWTRFAKYGNFTSDEWEPLNKKSNSIKNLHISAAGFVQEEDILKERANFWKFLNKNILV